MPQLATTAAFGFGDFDPPVILSLYRRLGCTSCQFYRNEANPPTVADARRITSDAGLPIDSIHGLFGPGYDPSCPDESVRKRSVEVYRGEGELAAALGGPRVVVHPSPTAPEGLKISEARRRERAAPFQKSLNDLAKIGEQLGVVYLFENNPNNYWFGNDPLEVAAMVRAMKSPHLRMCYDLGHAQMTGPVCERLEKCADVVSYLHVHDNDAIVDDHRMPGDGVMDWEQVGRTMAQLKLNVPAMLEVFYLRDKLEALTHTNLSEKLHRWLAVGS